MFQSVALFVLLLFVCILFSHKAEKENKILFLIFLAVILSFISGMRAYNVGEDTKNYVYFFKLISAGQSEYAYGLEPQFKLFCKILAKIWDNPSILLIVCSFITNFFVIVRIWDFKENASVVLMIVVYYVSFYLFTFNIMRQMCAVAILFYGSRFIDRGHYIKYLIFIFFAWVFHQSALIGVLFICCDVFLWKYLNKYQKVSLVILLLTTALSAPYLYKMMSKYFHYFRMGPDFEISYMMFAKLIIYIFCLDDIRNYSVLKMERVSHSQFVLVLKDNNKFYIKRVKQYKNKCLYQVQRAGIYYFMGICLTFLSCFPYMDRVGLPFYIFEIAFWGAVAKSAKKRKIYVLVFSLLLIYIFCISMIKDGQGIFPYGLMWQGV